MLLASFRAFLHSCISLSLRLSVWLSGWQRGQVAGMVQPGIAAGEECRYFWDHLGRDLQVLQKVLGRSADDVYLVLHHLTHLLTTVRSGGCL